MTQPPSYFGQPQRPQGAAPAPWQQGPAGGRPTQQSSFGGWGGPPPPPNWQQGPPIRPPYQSPQPYGQQPQQYAQPQQYGQPQPYGQQPWGQPQQGPPPGQFGPYGPGWQQTAQPRKRPTGLLWALGTAGVVLAGLLGYAFLNPGSDQATDPPGSYQNEEYELPEVGDSVPRIPIPDTADEATQWLDDNALYGVTLATPVRCDLAPFDDVSSVTDDELEERMDGYVGCLTRVWGPALKEAGFIDYQPELSVYPAGGEVNTRCGTQPSHNAFYCGADQQIYLAADILAVLPDAEASERVVFDLIIAHEYAHAVQGRSGIFTASNYAASEASSEPEAIEYSRRVEVQADCMAGLVVNSIGADLGVDANDRDALGRITYEIGDDRLAERFEIEDAGIGDHGTGNNRRLWLERGLDSSSVAVCNTYTAPSAEVE